MNSEAVSHKQENVASQFENVREGKPTRSLNMNDDKTIRLDAEAYYEERAGQEEIYLEETEEELRSILTSDGPKARYWRIRREEQEVDWEEHISIVAEANDSD